MGVTDRLSGMWNAWQTGGLPAALLISVLALAGVLWLASIVLTARLAARHYRSPFWWALVIVALPVAALGPSLLWPGSFPWFAAGGGVVAALLMLMSRALVRRSITTCGNGHEMAPFWVHCPHCVPAPAPAPQPAAHSDSAPAQSPLQPGVPLYNPVGAAIAPGMPAMHAGYGPQFGRPQEPLGPIMIRLIPESSGASEHIVTARGALLGRNPAAEITIDDQSASWDHARVIDRGGSPSVVDLGSSNGTFVNGERVETSLLISGDRLRVGDTVFKVVS